MSEKTKIERVVAPIRVQAEEILRKDILEGRLRSGERLVENEICKRFGVSRPLVRECLRQLQAEKLVSYEPHSGLRVASIGIQEAYELYDVRILLEPYAAKEFTLKASDSQRLLLSETTQDMVDAITLADKHTAIKHKNSFYKILIKGAHHFVLEQTLIGLQNRILLMRGVSMSVPGRLEETAREIVRLQKAIEEKDSELARQVSQEHLERARKTTIMALKNQDLPAN
ncbi:GntR family transcriptional regulator [Halomonas alkalisoli]|uniref:GntR family transcriptional regulator n=1 Tax=Halomonas alkalisoli TaxID=2907158 RepID=UPI001F490446|nr:GntR family transcriptional regulator [Halomonas alkalisoli]MCE9681693.1 GntR family transcriptional regulator [Halomonas alkalisoli]